MDRELCLISSSWLFRVFFRMAAYELVLKISTHAKRCWASVLGMHAGWRHQSWNWFLRVAQMFHLQEICSLKEMSHRLPDVPDPSNMAPSRWWARGDRSDLLGGLKWSRCFGFTDWDHWCCRCAERWAPCCQRESSKMLSCSVHVRMDLNFIGEHLRYLPVGSRCDIWPLNGQLWSPLSLMTFMLGICCHREEGLMFLIRLLEKSY